MFSFIRGQIELYMLVALVVLAAALNIWVRTATVKDAYYYVQQEKELRKLQREVQNNRVQWLHATTPERLKKFAYSLNLHPPAMNQLLKYQPFEGVQKIGKN